MARGDGAPTRERLMDAGMKLFAERGFRATRVEDIEVAVGLQPRRGAMYKHFRSKRELLEAAIQRHLASTSATANQLRNVDPSQFADASDVELRAFLVMLGRWFLDELDRQRDMTRILEHEGADLQHLADLIQEQIVDVGYDAAAGLLAGTAAPYVDTRAVAVALLGSLAAARRTAWTFGATPLGVDDDRLLSAWASICLAWRRVDGSP